MGVQSTVSTKFTAIDKFTAPITKMATATQSFAAKAEVGVARANRAFRSLTSPLRSLSRQLGQLGVVLGATAVIGVVGGAINIFKDFEAANKTLASVMATATDPQLKALQEDAKRLGATTAKSATEVVALQEAFARLGFETPEIINMTESTIAGSVAMNSALDETANLVGAMVRTFDDFSSADAPQIIDMMTAATQKSALSFEKLNTALPIVSGAANAAGVPMNQLLALLGKLSDAGIDASSSSTALRNIFLESASQGLTYSQILDKIVANQDQLTASNDEFGKRAAVSGVILAKNIAATNSLGKELLGTGGAAQEAADKQLNSLNGALTILESSYRGFILSLEDGNGAFGEFLTKTVRVASEMLSLASGSAKAESELTAQELAIRGIAETATTVVKVIGYVVAGMVAFKAILVASSIAIGAYNIGLGIMGALSGTASIAIGQNALALGAYKTVLALAAANQWLLNSAIGIGLLPLTLLVAGVALAIKYWDDWGAAVTLVGGIIAAFFSPFVAVIALVVSLVMSLYRHWNMIGEAFSNGGILAGIKAIGLALLDSVLYPIQQILEIASNIPGSIGDFAAQGAASIEGFRQTLGVEGESEPVNPKAAEQEALMMRQEKTTTTKNELLIRDETGRAEMQGDDAIGIELIPTIGF